MEKKGLIPMKCAKRLLKWVDEVVFGNSAFDKEKVKKDLNNTLSKIDKTDTLKTLLSDSKQKYYEFYDNKTRFENRLNSLT